MFTTGSKLFLGATGISLVSAIAWGVLKGGDVGWTGSIGLLSLTVVFAFLAGINFFVRDCNVGSMQEGATTESAAAQPRPGSSLWPMVGALGLGLVVIGTISRPVVFQAGLVVVLAAIVEWMVQAWSERASSDPVYNASVRKRILHPLEFPILAAIVVGIVVYSFSRIMLFLSKTSGPVVFGVIAALILLVGFLFASRPTLQRSVTIGVCTIAGLGLVSTGAVMAIDGERDIHVYEIIAEHPDVCSSTEPTEADEKFSQTVAATANIAAYVTFENGQLSARVIGIPGDVDTITLPRSNPSNILFTNLDDAEVRLTANLGEFSSDQNGTTVVERPVTCTALVEEDGEQLLTLVMSKSSVSSAAPYTLTVPGVEGTSIEIVVP